MNIFNAIFKTLLLAVLTTAVYYFVQFYNAYSKANKYTYMIKPGEQSQRINNSTDVIEFINVDKENGGFKFMEVEKIKAQSQSEY